MTEPPAEPRYPHHWEADVVLRDGATAHLRPIRAADVEAVRTFHSGQSENSIYMRFFTYKSVLSDKELRRFTEVDHRDRVAFVITVAGAIIGIGRYDRLPDPSVAEVAFNISDAHQGRGLGSILLEHLAAAARENGITRFTAEVLPENRKMLTVFAEAGYEVSRHFDDGVVSLSFDIDPTEKSRAVMESREHRAEARSVAGLLSPASVAVIGGRAPDAGAATGGESLAEQLLENLVRGGFTGPVHRVNRLDPESFPTIAAVGSVVDLVIIAVPYDQVPATVAECAAAGSKGVLIATGGFADDGELGLVAQRGLVRTARAGGMRLIGPASLGVVNTRPGVSLNASLAPTMPKRGSLGLFSQSAALGAALFAATVQRGLGFSTVVSAGNRADVSGNDIMQYWEDDADTAVCGLYLESIGNPRKFSRLARRLARSKPVIVAKSDALGLQLPPGHAVRTTQAPVGALDAMLRQSGVIRVRTIDELADVAQIAVSQSLPAGPRLAVLSNSLALARVVADSAAQRELSVTRTEAGLRLDGGPEAALPKLREKLLSALRSSDVDSVILTMLPVRSLSVREIAGTLAECAAEVGKPVLAAFSGFVDQQVTVNGLLHAETAAGPLSVPGYTSPGAAIAALAALVRYTAWLRREQGHFEDPPGIDRVAAEEFIEARLSGTESAELLTLSAAETARLLACYGIEPLPSIPFGTVREAVAAAEQLGWPVAIKTLDSALRHRLDLGGVRLNIDDAAALGANIAQMRESLRAFGNFDLEVQSMAPVGQSCVLRAIEDPLLGPVVSFGLAGDAVNLLDDWAHRIPPLSSTDVSELVRSPKAAARLFGYQGLPPVNIAALQDLVARLAALKDHHPEVASVEFHPVLAGSATATVLSALVKLGNAEQRTDSARRAMNA
ncbi:bifunctional acetate--CoA ligase family protein/GNAT family N-acetyltransferase [Arthrobacter russicus]|jgi:acyl-CoA synthetase (NDP forming)/RimJ/RimL family protein N-acetyltransferase|uniref:Acyl-CoA synthetase (NDP forming)/RimJ/RimL family protein N-acetyltransferase n=1 Tax=Arthrobacter russicus TaxID=172040 RepID=A0ABU1JFD8_9MICC|nr:GNAT family N-acetyltransferase [Arthrobacter russicus]MDR6271164.1 acyl-CoA synthetase (NDP forming)/RimJ/RimL family protein N-acetyltransferase [Arthrobacter russicus]